VGENIVRSAPVLCIEVPSKDDTLESIRDRVDDYLRMGVENVWVVDPLQHLAYRASTVGYEAVSGILTIAGTPVQIDFDNAFQELVDLLAGRL
jgi:Uma2 family endonuclease